MLPSILGNGRVELVPVGIVFLTVGIALRQKDDDAKSTEND